jgi:hypothetical protein
MLCLCEQEATFFREFGTPYRTHVNDKNDPVVHRWWCPISLMSRLQKFERNTIMSITRLPWKGICLTCAMMFAVLSIALVFRFAWLHDEKQNRLFAEEQQRAAQRIQSDIEYDRRTNDTCAKMCKASRVMSCHISYDPSWPNKMIIAVCLNSGSDAAVNAISEEMLDK